jgi:predicted TIM-barrel fold metal-dependent hydrolase
MDRCGIEYAVLVQHLGEFDNTYLAKVVEKYPERLAAVALIDPGRLWVKTLERLINSQLFRGVRVNSDMMTANPELCAAVLRRGLNLIACIDESRPLVPQILWGLAHMKMTGKIVLSHLGGLLVGSERASDSSLSLDLANSQNVFVNFSGLSMYGEYPYEKFDGLIRMLIGRFGANRLMWGSNYPVCGDAESYLRDLQLMRPGAWDLSYNEIQLILHYNAKKVWFGQ